MALSLDCKDALKAVAKHLVRCVEEGTMTYTASVATEFIVRTELQKLDERFHLPLKAEHKKEAEKTA